MSDDPQIEKNLIASNETTIEELTELFRKLDDLFWAGHFDVVNQILLDLDISSTRIEMLVGYMRYSSCAKDMLPDWKNVVNTVRDEVEKRGFDPNRIMRGLLDEGKRSSSNTAT